MEQTKRHGRLKVAIVVLAVLLGLSLLALAGTLIYDRVISGRPTMVAVPDNLITPESETAASATASGDAAEMPTTTSPADATTSPAAANGTARTRTADADRAAGTTGTAKAPEAATIALYKRQPEENRPFRVGNMFPGDAETQYFRVQVSYHDQVTVHYHAAVRPGYEKLAEVLRVKIVLLSDGSELYDGLMRDMPESLTHTLTASDAATDELYYQITAYLDTDVGNEYQNRDLAADFTWWVEETGNLEPPVPTGVRSSAGFWVLLSAVSGAACLILLLFVRRRDKEATENA